MRWLVILFAGCAIPSAAVLPASGCIERVGHGKHSYLTKNGERISNDLMAATAGDPDAQKLAARAANEDTAAIVFLAAAPTLFLSAVVGALAAPNSQASSTAFPILLGADGASIGMAIVMVLASGVHHDEAIDRYNRDAGCR